MADKDFDKINQSPQAKDDLFTGTQNNGVLLDVMANDLGGNGKSLYSLNQVDPNVVSASAVTALGATVSIVNGKIQYSATSSAITALGAGQTATDTFYYTIQMGNNGTLSLAAVTVTVTGTNDAPVVSGVVTGVAVEDGAPSILNGLAKASDVDAGTTLSVVGVPASLPAGVTYAANSFSLNPANAAYQSLGHGQTTTVTVNYGVSDGAITVPASVSWTVTGTNDGPVAVADTGSAVEDGGPVVLNVLGNDTDIDNGDTKTLVGVSTAGTVGAVTANANGTVTYNPGANFQSLGLGQTATDTFSYTMKDAAGATSTATVTMTIAGTNDGPVAMDDAGFGNEDDAGITINVLGNDTDVDNGDTKTLVSVTNGAFGTVTANADGTVTFNMPAAAQTLSAGEIGTDTFTYTMRDSAGATSTASVTVTVTGSNDAPSVVAANTTATGSVTELPDGAPGENATNLSTSGSIFVADPDDEDVHIITSVVRGGNDYFGGFFFQPDPLNDRINWTFNAQDAGLNILAAGQTKVQTYDLTISDQQGGATHQTLTITLNGANDAPFIYDLPPFNFTEFPGSGSLSQGFSNGGVGLLDPDRTDVHTVSTSLPTVTLGGGGSIPGATLAALNTAFTPSIAADSTGVLNGTGSIGLQYSLPDSLLNFLNAGQVMTATYNLTISDGQGGTYTRPVIFNFTGANDGPQVSGPVVGAGAEDSAPITLNALANASDADQGAALQVTGVPGSLPPGVTYNPATQSFTLNPSNAAYQHLAPGQPQQVQVNYQVTDGQASTPATVVWNLTGTNDAPVAQNDTAVAFEDGAPIGLNVLGNDSDVDDGDTRTVISVNTAGTVGSVSLVGGNLAYGVGPNFQGLAAGQTATDTFTYTMRDTAGATSSSQVTVTVNGVNDAPVLKGQSNPNLVANGGFEAGGASWVNTGSGGVEVGPPGVYGVNGATGLVMELDVNGGSHDNVSQTVATSAGTPYTFSFDIAQRAGFPGSTNAVQVLFNGVVIDTVTPASTTMQHQTYTVVSNGATGKIEFNEVGPDDGVGGMIDNVSLVAAGFPERTLQTGSSAIDSFSTVLSFSDVDLIDTHTVTVGAPTLTLAGGPIPGGLSAALTGALSASLTEASGSGAVTATFSAPDNLFDFLGVTQALKVNYNVTVVDNHGASSTQTATVVIVGSNDAPTLQAAIPDQAVGIFNPLSYTIPAGSMVDVDTGAVLSFSTSALPGWLSFNAATRTFTGTAQGPQVGFTDITVTATDQYGASISDIFRLTVTDQAVNVSGDAGGNAYTSGSFADTLAGLDGPDTLTGAGGSDNLNGGNGSDRIYGDDVAGGGFGLTPTAASYYLAGNSLINGLGASPGGGASTTFGEGLVPIEDDNFVSVDVSSVFTGGLNFFGSSFSSLFVNNNGSISFGSGVSAYVATAIASGATKIIAPFWADVDTRGTSPAVVPTPGGTSTGTNNVYYDLDTTNHVFTVTWDDVGYYNLHTTPVNAFQLQLVDRGTGDFDIIFRYEAVNWLTGDASGGVLPRAGYTAANGVNYFELPGSATASVGTWDTTAGNTGMNGVYMFQVRNGGVVNNNDTLTGGIGNDTLTGGIGNDAFNFISPSDSVDLITDFTSGYDDIRVSAAGFGGGLVAGGAVSVANVADHTTASSGAGGYFIMESSTNIVWWDANGGSGADAVALAQLTGVNTLFSGDFAVGA